MKVLHVHSGNLYGGVETLLATLAHSRRASPDIDMAVALSFDGRIGQELRAEGVQTPLLGEVRLRKPGSVWRARRALSALLNKETFDVAICHQAWPHAVFGPVIKAARVPLVVWVHMVQNEGHWLERLAWRTRPDCIISNSRFTASTLPPTSARMEVIYPPITLDGHTGYASRNAIRAGASTAPEDVVIVQVSRMEAMKGQTVLLEALAGLRERSNWTLWQVGGAQRPEEARYLDGLRSTAQRLGITDRIRFLGHRFDVGALLSAADVFCQPNLAPEGFGISFVEAMAAGLPVITSAIGGAMEIVDASCGVLLPPGEVPALAGALSSLIQDGGERARLGAAGRTRAAQLCDPDMQTRRLAALLKELV